MTDIQKERIQNQMDILSRHLESLTDQAKQEQEEINIELAQDMTNTFAQKIAWNIKAMEEISKYCGQDLINIINPSPTSELELFANNAIIMFQNNYFAPDIHDFVHTYQLDLQKVQDIKKFLQVVKSALDRKILEN